MGAYECRTAADVPSDVARAGENERSMESERINEGR